MPGWADVQSVMEGVSISDDVPADRGVLLLVADRAGTLRKATEALTSR